MYCNKCGTSLKDDALICPNCGHSVPGVPVPTEELIAAPSEPPAEPPNARASGCGWAMTAGMLAGCAILLIVSLAVLGVYQGMQERTRLNRAAATEHYHKGVEQLAAENYELARAEFELALQLDPNNRDAAAKLAEANALLSSRATPTSATRHQTAILLYNEARDLYNKSDWQGVIGKLQQVQALEPEYEREQVTMLLVEAYYKAGLRLADEGRMEEAIRHFDHALELRPAAQDIREQKRFASLYAAGLGYWGANWQGVIDSFTVLYQMKPDYKDTKQRLHDAYVAYGDAFSTKKDWCAARDRYDSALAITSSDTTRAKKEEAAQLCAIASLPTGTPPPKGTFVGSVLKVEDVGRKEAMMIRGYVFDEQGKAKVGVHVGLSAFDWSAPPATTNDEGIFAFDGLANPVTYTVALVDLPAVPLAVRTDWSKLVWVEFRPRP